MTTLAVARLRDVNFGPSIIAYLERIDETLERFDGHFLVHGAAPEKLEGDWTGDLVIIEFPDRAHARAWYDSAEYRAILHLRTDHSRGDVFFVDTVVRSYRAAAGLKKLLSHAPIEVAQPCE